jgi:hypothetical protein
MNFYFIALLTYFFQKNIVYTLKKEENWGWPYVNRMADRFEDLKTDREQTKVSSILSYLLLCSPCMLDARPPRCFTKKIKNSSVDNAADGFACLLVTNNRACYMKINNAEHA